MEDIRIQKNESKQNTLITLIEGNPAFSSNDLLKVAELVTNMMAGFNMTGYKLSTTLVLLAQHPDVMKKACELTATAAGNGNSEMTMMTMMMTDMIRYILAKSN